eukprot:508737_1
MIIPKEFKLSTTNVALQMFFKSILCQVELHLGYESVGNINMFSLCELYQSGLNKVKLNINKLDKKTVHKLILNTTANDDVIKKTIIASLVNYGETKAVEW